MHHPALLFLTQLLVFSLGQLLLGLGMWARDRRRQREREKQKIAAEHKARAQALAARKLFPRQSVRSTCLPCPGLWFTSERAGNGGHRIIPSNRMVAGNVDGIYINRPGQAVS